MSNQPMIACELLAYVSTYRQRSTEYNLRLAILQHYTNERICEAKAIMEENVKRCIPAYPHFGKKRTDSPNRTASEAMISDILEMFKWLENVEDTSSIPVFVAVDVSKLPSASPESAADMMSVMETLASQQRQLQQMQETMVKIRADVDDNRAEIQKPQRPANQARSQVQGPNPVQDAPIAPGTEGASAAGNEVREEVHAGQTKGAAVSRDAEKPGVSYADKTRVNPGPLRAEDPFQKGGKRPNKGASSVKPQRVSGTSDSALLLTGPTTIQVQITNLSKEVSEDAIKDYIASVNDGSVQVQSVEDKTSDGWETKRFVLTFEAKYADTVLSKDFWPKKIYFKRWFPSRVQKSTSGVKL